MKIREATIKDIKQIQVVRNSVKENTLSDPNLVTDKDCEEYITERGKGWVCEMNDQIVGFAIADLVENNIWALFGDPSFEKRGIGRLLHNNMLEWYFTQSNKTLWLSTTFNTRAEAFYKRAGWKEADLYGTKEIKFEMTRRDWTKRASV